MIELTRLNNQPLLVNSDLIKLVDPAHDTVITLISGEKIVVRENAAEVLERVVQYRKRILEGLAVTPNIVCLHPSVPVVEQPQEEEQEEEE